MFNVIKKLFSKPDSGVLSSFSSGSSGSTCGIDIGGGSVKVVQVKEEKGKIILETYGALSLAPFAREPIGKPARLSDVDTAKAITQLIQEAKVTAKNFVVSLQSNAILVFVITLPRASAHDLGTILPNEARKYIPVPITEVALDWFIIPDKETYDEEVSTPSTTIEVLVVAVRNETFSNYQSICTQVSIQNPIFEIESFATMRSVLYREIAPLLIVDVGTAFTSMMIVEYGVIRIFHIANRGSAFVTESIMRSLSVPFEKAEEMKYNAIKHPEIQSTIDAAHEYLIAEMKRVMLEYEHAHSRVVSKIILSGGGAVVNGFITKVATETGIETVFANPFAKVEAPDFMRPLLQSSGPTFSVATGLALKNLLSF